MSTQDLDDPPASQTAVRAPESKEGTQLLAPLPPAKVWWWTQRALAAALLVASLPILAVALVATRLASPGPFLSRSRREGFLGVPFDLLKIRTSDMPGPFYEPQQTTTSTLLRRMKIDEIPTLWNVVKGELLLVGPRPMPLEVADELRERYPEFAERARVIPGMTNLGMIGQAYDESVANGKPDFSILLDADKHFLENRSFSYEMLTLGLTARFLAHRTLRSIIWTRKGPVRPNSSVGRDLDEWAGAEGLRYRKSSLAWSMAQRFLAGLGIVALSPVFAAMYVGVKVTSPGPFLFIQKRRGFGGRPFNIYKVRTMSVGSEKRTALGVQLTDPAVTKLGKIFRNLKLDELPQLFNVVKGDMELVGPRPIPMALEDRLTEAIPSFSLRHLVKPGLTNVAQVSVVDNELDDRLVADWTLRAEAERHYVEGKSVAYDCVMIVMTAIFIVRKALRKDAPEITETRATKVLGSPIDHTSYDDLVMRFGAWIEAGTTQRYVCIAPVHSVVEGVLNQSHRESLDGADVITADGVPVVWAQRLLGHGEATRVYGPTLMLEACAAAAEKGWRVALFGGRDDRRELLESRLGKKFPDLEIVFSESPPFRKLSEEEDEDLVKRINEAKADIIWVGLGCPKQERFMYEHRDRVNGIMVGVGAAFDFHAGTLAQAPSWMQKSGLEWLFRLYKEPRRLFKRYATTNPIFIALLAGQFMSRVILRRKHQVNRGSIQD